MLISTVKLPAHQWFFPAASIHAAIMVPLALLAMYGHGPGALASPAAHGFEMLFGFALALVAGYLLGPLPTARLAALLGLWLLARAAHLLAPGDALLALVNGAFALLLAWYLVPRLFAAKKWRNQAIAPLLGLLCLLALVVGLAAYLEAAALRQWLLRESVQPFALLMLFMGGRVLAPAVAGEFQRQGLELQARVQPRLEGALIVLLGAAFVLTPFTATQALAALALIAAGLVAATRLGRWQLWRCGARPDLICLGVGYGWLALGLMALGWAKLSGAPTSVALHVITVGALGTLATGVMARIALQRSKRAPAGEARIIIITAMIAVAATARAAAGLGVASAQLLPLSAAAWSAAFLLLSHLLLSVKPSRRRER